MQGLRAEQIENGLHSIADTQFLAAVSDAFCDADVHVFIKTSLRDCLETFEKTRRWGIVCICCREQRAAQRLRGVGPQSKCPWASRRLHQVRIFLSDTQREMVRLSNAMDLGSYEGNQHMMQASLNSLRGCISELVSKTNWCTKVPWLLSEADVPEIANTCHSQLSSIPDDHADSLLVHYKHTLLEPLRVLLLRYQKNQNQISK